MNQIQNFQKSSLTNLKKANNFIAKNRKPLMLTLLFAASSSIYAQDNLTEGLEGISTTFEQEWWPRIKVIAYILAGVFALFGLVNVFKQSQRGEDNVGKVAGAWVGGLAVFLLGIWAVDTFIIGAATGA